MVVDVCALILLGFSRQLDSCTPVLAAARGAHMRCLRWLLKCGADIYSCSPNGATALCFVAARAEELRQERKQVGRECKNGLKHWSAVIEQQIEASQAAAAASASGSTSIEARVSGAADGAAAASYGGGMTDAATFLMRGTEVAQRAHAEATVLRRRVNDARSAGRAQEAALRQLIAMGGTYSCTCLRSNHIFCLTLLTIKLALR